MSILTAGMRTTYLEVPCSRFMVVFRVFVVSLTVDLVLVSSLVESGSDGGFEDCSENEERGKQEATIMMIGTIFTQ